MTAVYYILLAVVHFVDDVMQKLYVNGNVRVYIVGTCALALHTCIYTTSTSTQVKLTCMHDVCVANSHLPLKILKCFEDVCL